MSIDEFEEILVLIIDNQIAEAKGRLKLLKKSDELCNSLHRIFKMFLKNNLFACETYLKDLNPRVKSSEIRQKVQMIKLILTLQIYLLQKNKQEAQNLITNLKPLALGSPLAEKAIERFESSQKSKADPSEKEYFIRHYTEHSKLKENSKWFVVSSEWFTTWKVKAGLRPNSHSEIFPFDKLWSSQTVESLGQIDNSSIIDENAAEELDIRHTRNPMIKLALVQNVHFVLLPEQAYRFLSGIYKAKQEIQRYVISDFNGLKVEVYLNQLTVVYFKSFKLVQKFHYASAKARLKDICEKVLIQSNLKTISDNFQRVKLWKMNQNITSFAKLEQIKKKLEKEKIPGLIQLDLADSLQILKFEYQDYLFFDISINDQFLPLHPPKEKTCLICSSSQNLLKCQKCSKRFCESCIKPHKKQSKACNDKPSRLFSFLTCFCRPKSTKPSNKYATPRSSLKFPDNRVISSSSTYNFAWSSFVTTGLENLGNTCFLNSALQCLAHCDLLSQFLLSTNLQQRDFKNGKGKLVKAYQELLQDMCGKMKTIAPWVLKSIVGKMASQFEGIQEQDSQEFLCYFIAGLHEDLNEISKKSLSFVEVKFNTDAEASQESWKRFLMLNKSPVVDFMYGQFKSTLYCPKCKSFSYAFDPFSCISLPIPQNVRSNIEVKFCPYSLLAELQTISLPSDQFINFFEAKAWLCKKLGKPFEDLRIFELKEKFPHKEVDYSEKVSSSTKIIYEVPNAFNTVCFVGIGFEGSKIQFPFRALGIESSHTFDKLLSEIRSFLLPIQKEVLADLQDFVVSISGVSNGIIECFVSKKEKIDKPCKVSPTPELIQDYLTAANTCYIKITLPKITRANFDYLKYIEFKKPSSALTIYDCFRAFSVPETLDLSNCWTCFHCKSQVTAQKKLEIYKTPPVLIIHLKRFRVFRNYREKIKARVKFPAENLDIQEFVLGSSVGLYDLFAVCNHTGSLSGGHYTATVYNSNRSEWFECNDSRVYQASDFSETSAYVLFYRAKNYVKLKV